MTVINNLIKFKTWRIPVFFALNNQNFNVLRHFKNKNSFDEHRVLNVKVHSYVVQKVDPNRVLQNAEKLREILNKKGRLSAVDMDLCSKIYTSTVNDILIHLHSFVLLDASYCLNSLFYKVFKEYLRKGPVERLKWDQLIQIIYYMSHFKDEETNVITYKCLQQVKRCPEILTSDYRDLCVIMEATSITNTFIKQDKIFNRVKQILTDEIFNLIEDPIWLSMICKGLRNSEFYDQPMLVNLAENLKRSSLVDNFSLVNISYITSLYGAALVKDEVLLDILTRASVKNIRTFLDKKNLGKNKGLEKRPRIKDLSRVLYHLMRLNHSLDKSIVDAVFVTFFEQASKESRKKNFELLVHYEITCLTGFWFMGYDLSLIRKTCQEVAEGLPKSYFRTSDYQRSCIFLDILELGYPKLLTSHLQNIKNTAFKKFSEIGNPLLDKRGNLIHLQKIIDRFKNELNISKCFIENIVPSLCVEGVTVEIGTKKAHIDLLEFQYCLMDSEEPNGIMATKMKLVPMVPGVSQHVVLPNKELIKLVKLKDADAVSYLQKVLKSSSSEKVQNVYYWEI